MELSIQRTTPIQQNMNTNISSSSAPSAMPEAVALEKPVAANKAEAGKKYSEDEQSQRELTKDETQQLTKQLNEFFKKMNASLEFEIHEKTDRLIVKFVDKKEDKVIKEFPPKELLDTLAAIQEYVGILLDKKV